ncbi:hypothetical protein HHK36_030346 [Tetracentron sinense]|uniref:Uncharacterized protein n=1 Tax=Tetracentron sinense TaxID=13715 RepID=A0A834YCP4_TETSI|nr:hypothetical protein HHK36_030346 [Tetracentron sinense]
MGGICSRSSTVDNASSGSFQHANGHGDHGTGMGSQSRGSSSITNSSLTPPPMGESMEKELREPVSLPEMNTAAYGSSQGDIDDGIPSLSRSQSHKSISTKSKQTAVAKRVEGRSGRGGGHGEELAIALTQVPLINSFPILWLLLFAIYSPFAFSVSEVSLLLGKAGTLGLGKAVEVLDTLGSSITNLNLSSGFGSGVTTKGNKISILAFEVANTIVKGANLMQSLSKENVIHLKQVVLPSEGVRHLVSKDLDELLRIASADKREELKLFSGEVVRFGNRCKDPQWHNLDRYFEKLGTELTPQNQLKEEAEAMIQQLMTLVQYTAELYHELHALDRFEQDYSRKLQEEDNSNAAQKGDSLAILRAELKSQRKNVRTLQKKSLWSKILEEVMEKLVDIVYYLHLEIHDAFGSAVLYEDNGTMVHISHYLIATNLSSIGKFTVPLAMTMGEDLHGVVKELQQWRRLYGDKPVKGSLNNHKKLGSAGLALHYANIIAQIDTLVSRPSCMPPNTRDALYQGLPPSIKSALRSKLQAFQVNEELTVMQIKAEMEKTLQWLVPIATNTTKSEVNGKPAGQTDLIRIETLHHADKEKTEVCILELIMWLHHLVGQSRTGTNGGIRSPIKSPIRSPTQKAILLPIHKPNASSPILTVEDQVMLQDVNKRKLIPGISKSQEFDTVKNRLSKHNRLSKSNSHSPTRGIEEISPVTVPVMDFDIDRIKALDVIDGVDMLGSL